MIDVSQPVKTKICKYKIHEGERELPIDNFLFKKDSTLYSSPCKACRIKMWKRYVENNREKVKEKNRKYYIRNKEREVEYKKKYKRSNRRESWGRIVRLGGTDFKDYNEFISEIDNLPDVCDYCGIPENLIEKRYLRTTRLTLDRIDNSKGYIKGNITKACPTCNRIKTDFLAYSEMKDVGERYVKPRWQTKYKGQF